MNIFKGNAVSEFEYRRSWTIVFAVYINFMSQLNSVGGVGSFGAWVRRCRDSNFGIDPVGHVGPKILARINKNGRGRNFSVGEMYDFINFRYDNLKFYL